MHYPATFGTAPGGCLALILMSGVCQIQNVADRNQSPSRHCKNKKGPIRFIFFNVGYNVVVDQRVTVAPNFTHFNVIKITFNLPGDEPLQ